MIAKNNPFNIRNNIGNNWLGQTGSHKGFCVFSRLEYGVRSACIIVCRSYRKRGILTISEIVNAFAPPSENNTDKYIEFVCGVMNAFPFDIPVRSEFPILLHAMSVFEGNRVSEDFIKHVMESFKIVPYGCR